MDIQLQEKKIKSLKDMRVWLDDKEAEFEWTESCRCWDGLQFRFLTGKSYEEARQCKFKTYIASKNKELVDSFNHIYINSGFTKQDRINFESLKFDGLLMFRGLSILEFKNGLTYVDQWIKREEAKLKDFKAQQPKPKYTILKPFKLSQPVSERPDAPHYEAIRPIMKSHSR